MPSLELTVSSFLKILYVPVLLFATSTIFFDMEEGRYTVQELVLLCCMLAQYVDVIAPVS